jgi:branched-chain amino acid transport system permease protein
VLVMVLIGGQRSVAGPLIGALVLIGLEEVLKATTEHWKLAEGLIVILIVLALPNGVRDLLSMVLPEKQASPVIARSAATKQSSRPLPNPPPLAGEGRVGAPLAMTTEREAGHD